MTLLMDGSGKGKTTMLDQPFGINLRDSDKVILDANELKGPPIKEIVNEYFVNHSDALRLPGANFGGWTNRDEGKTYLDISQNIKDRDAAIAVGKALNRVAIWDLNNGAEISTKKIRVKAEPENLPRANKKRGRSNVFGCSTGSASAILRHQFIGFALRSFRDRATAAALDIFK